MFVFMWYLMIKHAIIMHLFGSKFSDTIEIQFRFYANLKCDHI